MTARLGGFDSAEFIGYVMRARDELRQRERAMYPTCDNASCSKNRHNRGNNTPV
jgi:hypothetical protein